MIALPDLVIGDVFYECRAGSITRFTVVTAPVTEDDYTIVLAIDDDGERIEFGHRYGFEYLLKLYKEPQYTNGSIA